MGAGPPSGEHCRIAKEHLKEGRVDEALASARQAIAANPQDADAYLVLGIGLCRNGLLPDGVAALQSAVRLRPESKAAQQNLGTACEATGAWEEALVAWRALAKLDPSNTKAQAGTHRAMAKLIEQGKPVPPEPGGAAPEAGSADHWDALIDEGPRPGRPSEPLAPWETPPAPPGAPPPGYPPQGPGPLPRPVAQGDDPGGWSLENVLSIVTEPVSFFDSLRGYRGFAAPITFFMVAVAIGLGFQTVFGAITLLRSPHGAGGGQAYGLGAMVGVLCVTAVVAIPLAAGLQFVAAAIYHVCLLMFGPKGDYPATFRACVYSVVPGLLVGVVGGLIQAAVPALAVVAMLLSLAATPWTIAVMVIGFSRLHEIEWWKGLIAALIPTVAFTVVFCLCMGSLLAKSGLSWRNLTPTGIQRGAPTQMMNGPSFDGPQFDPSFGPPSGMGPGQPPGFPSGPPGGWR